MSFGFSVPGSIEFGPGCRRRLPGLVAGRGRALVVTGRHGAAVARDLLGDEHAYVLATGEPDVDAVRDGLDAARSGVGVVVGLGGGSAIDLAKVLAALAWGDAPAEDYLPFGDARPLPAAAPPVVALPTTAGTGAEVTANAPVRSRPERLKTSLRGPTLRPTWALVDPELTLSCPPRATAFAGMDALCQCLESYVSRAANGITRPLALEGLRLLGRSLERAVAGGDDLAARVDVSLAALLSGMALANSGLGSVHAFAAALGGMLDAPHGGLCAAVLPAATRVNVRALRERGGEEDAGAPAGGAHGAGTAAPAGGASGAPAALDRYREALAMVIGRPGADVDESVDALQALVGRWGARGLAAWGLAESDLGAAGDAALAASSMRGNPVALTRAEAKEVAQLSFAPTLG